MYFPNGSPLSSPHTPCQERQMPKLAVEGSWRRKWPRKLWQMRFLWGISILELRLYILVQSGS